MFNFLKNKWKELGDRRYFDEKNISIDAWRVLKAASLLSVSEFRIFEIAYLKWYGEEGGEKAIEHYFLPYMFNDIVPFWVRQFCNQVLQLEKSGRLDPADFGLRKTMRSEEERSRGIEYVLWFAAAMLIFYIMLLRSVSSTLQI